MSEEIENSPQPPEAEPALDQVAATVIRAKREVAKVATQQRLGKMGAVGRCAMVSASRSPTLKSA